MTKYFRITAYYPKDNFSFIADSNGMFEQMWQFSAFMVNKGVKILEVAELDKTIDINIGTIDIDTNNVVVRVFQDDMPEYITQEYNGNTYKAIKVKDKIYIPNKTKNA